MDRAPEGGRSERAEDRSDTVDVARFNSGEVAAFDRLVRRRERAVFNLAMRMLGDREEAMDAVQETFLRAFRGLPRFRGDARFSTWVFGITLNVCRTRLTSAERRARGRRTVLSQVDENGDEREATVLADPGPSPEHLAYGAELRAALANALARIAPEHREVLLLREMHDMEYGEMAKALGCRLGTVKSRLNRARAALRSALSGVWP